MLRISLLLAATGLLFLPSCSSGGSSSGSTTAPANVSPFFRGANAAITAGGELVLLAWTAAQDDADLSSQIVYDVFASSTAGGQDFGTPLLTTAAGATRVEISSAQTSAIDEDQEVFFVVRARDSDGATDTNQVEVSCVPRPSSSVAFVTTDGSMAPDLGDPGNPFSSVQAALDALPGSGGIVLVGGGDYNELVGTTTVGEPGSSVAIYGSFAPGAITDTATADSLLDNYGSSITRIDGAGLTPVFPQVGVVDFRNMMRRSFIAGVLVDLDLLSVGLHANPGNVVIEDCSFEMSEPPMLAEGGASGTPILVDGFPLVTGVPATESQSVDIVGNTFEDLTEGVELTGAFERIAVSGNRAAAIDSTFLSTSSGEILDGVDLLLHFDANDFQSVDGNGFQVSLEPQAPGQTGSVTLNICNNRMQGLNSEAFEINDFGEHGSSIAITVEDNFIAAVDSHGFDFRFLPDNDSDNEFVRASNVDVHMARNTVIQLNSEAHNFDGVTPATQADWDLVLEDSVGLQCDSEFFEIDPSFPNTATFSQDMVDFSATIRRNDVGSADGFVELDQNASRGGSMNFAAYDNTAIELDDEGIDLDYNEFATMTTSQADDSFDWNLRFLRNTFRSPDSTGEQIELNLVPSSPTNSLLVEQNALNGERQTLDIVLEGMSIDDALVDIRIEGNRMIGNEDAEVLNLETSGMAGAGTELFYHVVNNLAQSNRDPIEVSNNMDGDPRGFAIFAHNETGRANEGDVFEFDSSHGDWSILVHRNLVLGGGDDAENGISLSTSADVSGFDVRLTNNLVAGSGEGIRLEGSVDVGEMINNTVAFTGQGSGDVAIGSNIGGADVSLTSPVYVLNNIAFGNFEFDIPEETLGLYSLFGVSEEETSIGLGSMESSFAGFTRQNSILDPNTFFTLAPVSPAINAGDPSADYNDTDGSRNNMGVFGGPGAGRVGTLDAIDSEIPLLFAGFDPQVELQTGARPISGTTPLRMVFGRPVDSTTTSAISITSNGGPVGGSFAVDGNDVTFTPTADWPARQSVRVVMGTGLSSTDGTSLAHRFVRTFPVAGAPTSEAEPNNTTANAQTIVASIATIQGDFGGGVDADTYSVMLGIGDRVQAAGRMAPGGGTLEGSGVTLRLIAPDGTTPLVENAGSLPGGDPMIDFTVSEAGTYFVQIANGTIPEGVLSQYELDLFIR
ncbi:MAG: Ig-like domain-containing protein [Planctomycetota bacterium]